MSGFDPIPSIEEQEEQLAEEGARDEARRRFDEGFAEYLHRRHEEVLEEEELGECPEPLEAGEGGER